MTSVILSLYYSGKRLGGAYYQEDSATVRLLEDTTETDDFQMLRAVLEEANPSQVLVSRSQKSEFINAVCRECNYTPVMVQDEKSGSRSYLGVTTSSKEMSGTQEAEPTQSSDLMLSRLTDESEDDFDAASLAKKPFVASQVFVVKNEPVVQVEKFRPATSSAVSVASSVRGFPGSRRSVSVAGANSQNGSKGSSGKFLTLENKSRNEEIIDLRDDEAEEVAVAEEEKDEDEEEKWTPALSFITGKAYDFERAKERLEQEFVDKSRVDNSVLLTAFRFNFSAVNMISALGALLSHLDQQRVGVEFEDHSVRVPIKAFLMAHLNDLVEVDEGTRTALEIFYSAYSPKCIRRKLVFGNVRKEGMSLLKLCNICRSAQGRSMLKGWFERPTMNAQVLNQRQDAIHQFYQDCNAEKVRELRDVLSGLKSLHCLLKRMEHANPTVADWKNLYSTCVALVKVGEWLKFMKLKLEIIADKQQSFNDELHQLAMLLYRVIDLSGSDEEERFVMKRGVDKELDRLKDIYDTLPDRMNRVAAQISRQIPGIGTCVVGYYPLIGYLLIVPEDYDLSDVPEFETMFTLDGNKHYRTPHTSELDAEIGDIRFAIIDRQTTVMLRLKKMVLKKSSLLLKALQAATILDCIASLAVVAREYNWIRPKMVKEPALEVLGARHPVAELLADKPGAYVPNPILSGGSYSRVKVLTGPNAAGKSVYLKMVGVITYLAHVGSFVPAERATIGLCNRILSRIHTVDSVLDGMSSFANDLKQISAAIRKCDARSLLIIDEFGKGTMTEVGLSLLASCLNYWLEKPAAECPNLFITSHYHSLPGYLRNPNRLLSYHTMEVLRPRDDEDEYDLDFQYRLVEGTIDNSYSTVTALKMGVPRDVVERADEIYNHLRAGLTLEQLKSVEEDVKVIDFEEEAELKSLMDQMRPLKHLFLQSDVLNSQARLKELADKHLIVEQRRGTSGEKATLEGAHHPATIGSAANSAMISSGAGSNFP